jgi:hypothetical protein
MADINAFETAPTIAVKYDSCAKPWLIYKRSRENFETAMRNIPPSFLLPGTVVTAPMRNWLGLTQHFGIVTNQRGPDGMPVMVANSRSAGGPAEESWVKFTEGRAQHSGAYYPSALAPELVLANAYGMFGSRYHLLKWNCEHYVNACHGLPATSRQVGQVRQAGFAFVALVGGIALAAARS